jgi:radical SAM superfamily enzyme YgiQ (UPF0313 family)
MPSCAASGLSRVGVSVESASQESLDWPGKGINAETIDPALHLLEKPQLPCQVNLIFFDPYITLEGVRRNLALVEYLRNSDYLSYSDAFPY